MDDYKISTLGLLGLPTEIIIKILTFDVGYRTLIACSRVCKLLHKIISDTLLLRYLIELDASGMVDNPDGCPMNLEKRLESLSSFQNAWSGTNDLIDEELPISLRNGAYELCQGHFCHASSNPPYIITVVELPSRIKNTITKSWTHPEESFCPYDIVMDPSQDLIVLLDLNDSGNPMSEPLITLHVRELSSGGPHLLAKQPEIHGVRGGYDIRSLKNSMIMQIRESFVLLYRSHDRTGFVSLVDWLSGEVLMDQEFPDYTSATFLDSSHLIMMHKCSIIEQAIRLDIDMFRIEFTEQAPTSSALLKHIRTFEILPFPPNYDVSDIACWCDVRGPIKPLDNPFSSSEASNAVTIHFDIHTTTDLANLHDHCSLIFPRNTLYSTEHNLHEELLDVDAPLRLPWSKWKDKGVVWRVGDTTQSYHRPTVSIDRCLIRRKTSRSQLSVVDINPLRSRKLGEVNPADVQHMIGKVKEYFGMSTDADCGHQLPHRILNIMELPTSFYGWSMIDEERILYQTPTRLVNENGMMVRKYFLRVIFF